MRVHDYASGYQSKSDEELRLLALDREDLIPEARLALEGELSRRRIAVTEPGAAQSVALDDSVSRMDAASLRRPAGATRFVAETVDIYQQHFWFFFKLTLPAVTLAWLVGLAINFQIRALSREMLHGHHNGQYGIYVFEGLVLNLTRYLITWIVFSLLFGALCIATQMIERGTPPAVGDSVSAVRSRLGSLLRISLLLFGDCDRNSIRHEPGGGRSVFDRRKIGLASPCAMASLIWDLLSGVSDPLALRPRDSRRDARWLPSVEAPFFRSDELTEGKWLILIALLTKSIIGGYLSGMAPFWVAGLMKLQLPSPWILPLISVAAVAAVEPILFIGFTLLYLRAASLSSPGSAGDTATALEQPA